MIISIAFQHGGYPPWNSIFLAISFPASSGLVVIDLSVEMHPYEKQHLFFLISPL